MTYEYITDLRNHLDTVVQLACENLAIAQTQQAEYYNQKNQTLPTQSEILKCCCYSQKHVINYRCVGMDPFSLWIN